MEIGKLVIILNKNIFRNINDFKYVKYKDNVLIGKGEWSRSPYISPNNIVGS